MAYKYQPIKDEMFGEEEDDARACYAEHIDNRHHKHQEQDHPAHGLVDEPQSHSHRGQLPVENDISPWRVSVSVELGWVYRSK